MDDELSKERQRQRAIRGFGKHIDNEERKRRKAESQKRRAGRRDEDSRRDDFCR